MLKKIILITMIWGVTVAFAQNDLSGFRFCIDPGHGNYPNTKPFETRINLRVAEFLKEYLENYGASVILTRTDSLQNPSLYQRDMLANNHGVDFFLSIHHNAYNGNSNRTLMLYQELPSGQPKWLGEADLMCNIMVDYLYNYLYTTGKSVRGDWSFYNPPFNLGVLKYLTMPGVLSEASFWDYVPEVHRLNALGYLKLEAFALLHSFLEYYSFPKPKISYIEGIVQDEDGEKLPNISVKLKNSNYEHNFITDSQNIGITAADNSWGGFPYIPVVKNGMFFFEKFDSSQAWLILNGENFYSDTVSITINDSIPSRISPITLVSTIPPKIITSIPEQDFQRFPAWEAIIIKFNRRMNTVSVEDNFSIEPELTGEIRWTENNSKLIFRADSMKFETEYTLTISESAVDIYGKPLDGNGDGNGGDAFILHLKTGPEDLSPPKLTMVYPASFMIDVELQPLLNYTFDEILDTTSIVDEIFQLKTIDNQKESPGTLKHYFFNNQSILCFFPTDQLDPRQRYQSILNPGLRDIFGNEMTTSRIFRFTTGDTWDDVKLIDDFETGLNNWLTPQNNIDSKGIISDSTNIMENVEIVNILTNSSKSLELQYGWDEEANTYLLCESLQSGPPSEVTFDKNHVIQVFVFGDGSNVQLRFVVDDHYPDVSAANQEVSPWFTVGWLGWKLLEWDMVNDGTGTWNTFGDGNLDGTLRFGSIQLTHTTGNPITGKLFFDDLRIVEKIKVDVEEQVSKLPKDFFLYQNFPNPFFAKGGSVLGGNSTTTIKFALPKQSMVSLKLYDMMGNEIQSLVKREYSAGIYSVVLNANKLASGVYLYRLETKYFNETQKLILLQ